MENTIRVSYCSKAPSQQTALDIFKGSWKSALPKELNLHTGAQTEFFNDARVLWVSSLLPNGFVGLNLLELGPFEGYNTYFFSKLGAKQITSIEANNINFLKCLILKDTLGLDVRFLYGDAVEYLSATKARYDIIWASGILYHSERPLDFLARIAEHTDHIFIWTHFFEETLLKNENRGYFDPEKNVEQNLLGELYTLHYRSYRLNGDLPLHYEGGVRSFSYWISRADIDRALRSLGFHNLQVHQVGHFSGMPYIGLLAQRV